MLNQYFVRRQVPGQGLLPQSKTDPSGLEQVPQSKRGSNGHPRKHSLQTVFLSESAGRASAGSEHICTQTVASDVNLCIPSNPANSAAVEAASGGMVKGNPDCPRTHGCPMISGAQSAYELTLEIALAGGWRSDQEPPR